MFYESLEYGKIGEMLEAKGKKILVYHRDADGVCSASLVMKFFGGFETVTREGPIIDDSFLKELTNRRPEILVFVDIPADQEWKKLERLKKSLPDLRVMIIDHHIVEKDMNPSGVVHVNPRMEDPGIYCPASYVVYRMLKKMGLKARPYVWISVIGIIGDYGFEDCGDVLQECAETYPSFMDVLDLRKGNGLSKAAEMISSAITLKGSKGAELSLECIVRCETLGDMKKCSNFLKWHGIVQEEIGNIMDDFEKNKELFPEKKLVIYQIRSKLNITSVIATAVAERHPEETIIIRKESNGGWKISMRNQKGDVNVGDLAKFSSKGIGSGGGHPKSAGAFVNDWDIFKERTMEFLK